MVNIFLIKVDKDSVLDYNQTIKCHSAKFLNRIYQVGYIASSIVKKTGSFILLFCMIVYLGGYQIISACYRLELKIEAHQFLKTNTCGDFLSVFEFELKDGEIQASNFEWEERDKEFKFHNTMYDVVKMETSNQKLFVYCYNDSGEDKLEKHLDEIHQKQNNPKASSTASFQKLISLSFETIKQQGHLLFPNELKFKFQGYDESVLFTTLEITVPPPDELIES